MDSTEIDTLYDHYKDTCGIIGSATGRRDRLMLWLVVATGLFSLEAFFPGAANQAVAALLKSKYDVTTPINLTLVGNAIWLFLLLIALRYFQTATYVERQYPYLHSVEEKLNAAMGKELIAREGKYYLSGYPLFSNWLNFLYKLAFPALVLALSTSKIVSEWFASGGMTPKFGLLVDAGLYLVLLISTVLYLLMLFSKPSADAPTTHKTTA